MKEHGSSVGLVVGKKTILVQSRSYNEKTNVRQTLKQSSISRAYDKQIYYSVEIDSS